MTEYNGTIFGFNYNIELENDTEFEIWLEAKLRKYLVPDNSIEKRVLEKILGLDIIKTKLDL